MMMHLETNLELDLWTALAEAAITPEKADLSGLWQLAEAAISRVPESLRLGVAGDVVLKMGEVYAARSNSLLAEWDRTWNGASTSMTVEGLAELLLRQSMHIDFSDLIEVPDYKYNRVDQSELKGNGTSIAVPVAKAELQDAFDSEIELVEAKAQEESAAMASSEEEDVEGWARAIAQWMHRRGNLEAISLVQLQQELRMPMIEVWLGVLLSQNQPYEWEQRGELYSLQGIWLRQK